MNPETTTNFYADTAHQYLQFLSADLPTRRMGSAGNQAATDFCARVLRSCGWEVSTPGFNCLDWVSRGAVCRVGASTFTVHSSPYSNGCRVSAPLRCAANMEDLYFLDCAGEILLLRGELTREQLMPRNYPFYNPEPHQKMVALLEQKAPAAIITATTRNPELAGGAYPFPLIEDGDFNIPSVYTTDRVGARLVRLDGQTVHLISQSERIPSSGVNVVARLNPSAAERIMICAHVDAKPGTPGALDNAAGVVTLLLLADLLKDYAGRFAIELLVMNGEDHYGAHGELAWLDQNTGNLGNIRLFINMDALGYMKGKTSFSFYNLLEKTRTALLEELSLHPGIMEGEQWYQSDHAIVVMNGVPAMAVTSERFMELCTKITHTAADVPALVDTARLVEAAVTIRNMIHALEAIED